MTNVNQNVNERQAVEWTDKNQPHDEEPGRFRAEAAALLGVSEAPPPQYKDSFQTLLAAYGGNFPY